VGVLFGEITVEPGDGGTLLTAPTAVTNPPIRLRFIGAAGWVDFGQGVLPPHVIKSLGTTVLEGHEALWADHVHEGPLDQTRDGRLFSALRGALGRIREELGFTGVPWHLVWNNLRVFSPSGRAVWVTAVSPAALRVRSAGPSGEVVAQFLMAPAELRNIRLRRGLSVDAVVRAVARVGGDPVTRDDIRGIESGARRDPTGLVWRLDHAYLAGGRLGLDRAHVRHGGDERVVSFAKGWVGPVWLQLAPEAAVPVVQLVEIV